MEVGEEAYLTEGMVGCEISGELSGEGQKLSSILYSLDLDLEEMLLVIQNQSKKIKMKIKIKIKIKIIKKF